MLLTQYQHCYIHNIDDFTEFAYSCSINSLGIFKAHSSLIFIFNQRHKHNQKYDWPVSWIKQWASDPPSVLIGLTSPPGVKVPKPGWGLLGK